MTTRTFPRTPRGFVQWCIDNGHGDVLVGKVEHDIRNIKSIANKYGYIWKNDPLSQPTNIQGTAMAIEELSDKSREDTEISKSPKLEVVKKAKDYVPAAVGSENWGSW
ncbi:hypothetical protein UFOVP26_62 [uncultured Caudovirales phage]|uniref:Uncharacterized protein n=1 Tax=uncultured Caudovirales phage TaxID=2100421 RepID=A0A6J7WQE3_9CAUD|nr:hypothetical protein UFOVP26_62 [uncultured Caudovirales phage]CAB4123689.1 hypothetical protein UFOVP44_35 [uncultured Caudovirales phage]CAB5219038.1 hypothetical protein UFOVP220_26 [uncultured Caudovirales phage]